MGYLLEIRNIRCGYGATEVIRGLSAAVSPGDILGVIGPNGSGKTTLFRAIGGILPPWSGSILYRGQAIGGMPRAAVAREIAVLPQFTDISFPFTVEEFVLMGRYARMGRVWSPTPRDRRAVEEALEATETGHLRDRVMSGLSGGERQRCLLAQGIAQEPALLLLDEPTAHLDIGHQIDALDMLMKFNKTKGITILIVLHDLNMAGTYCSRLLLLDGGRVEKDGPPREVLTYQTIEKVYKTVVLVTTHPVSGHPHVLPIPGFLRRRKHSPGRRSRRR